MPSLLDSIFGKQSLEEISLEEIHHVLAEFPSFNVAHYLLSRKLKLENDPAYEEETRKTALYFNNPVWLQWLLAEDIHPVPSVINEAYEPTEEEHTVNEAYSEVQEDVPIVNEEFRHEPEEEITVNEEYAQEAAAVPVIHDAFENEPGIPEHPPGEQEVLVEPEPVAITTEWEAIIMIPESEPAEIAVGFESSDFVQDTEPQRVHREFVNERDAFETESEHPEAAVKYEASDFVQEPEPKPVYPEVAAEPEVSEMMPETDPEPAEFVNESEASDFIADDRATEEIQEAEPVSRREFKPEPEEFISEPSISHQQSTVHVSEITPQPTPVFDAKKAESIVFEPYHMVDYFASQGIKLVLEENPQDSFGKQLKSFTDWLKVMKKIPAKSISGNTDEREAERIRHFAANSIEERDILTETMAEVLAKQGMYENAIALYQKLSLIYPPKSAYFASRIEQLKASLS
ncbi:MAG TPA: hypothetical protein VFC34_11145 [Puia sp.]|nr:hypothetical protein [Puia sp.]